MNQHNEIKPEDLHARYLNRVHASVFKPPTVYSTEQLAIYGWTDSVTFGANIPPYY